MWSLGERSELRYTFVSCHHMDEVSWGAPACGTSRSRPAPEAQPHLGDGARERRSKTAQDNEAESDETLRLEEVISSVRCHRESRMRRHENHVLWILYSAGH